MMPVSALPSREAPAVLPLPLGSLRHWLRGSWGLLFSHPDDFASYGFEADRWLVHVQEAFAAADTRPLALAPGAVSHGAGWIVDAGGRFVLVRNHESQRYPLWRQNRETALRTAVHGVTTRLVMMLDNSLRLRRTFTYTTPDRLPSPIDLAAIAGSLRRAAAPDSNAGRSDGALMSFVP